MRRLAEAAAWLAASGLMAIGLYWAFLNTPESRVTTLALSATLVLAMILVVAIGASATVLFVLGQSRGSSIAAGARRAYWFVTIAVAAAALVWAVFQLDAWVMRHAGEISAWFIATFNLPDVSLLFRAESYLSLWLRWVVIPSGLIAALASALTKGGHALVSTTWMRAAWRWQTLAMATGAFLLLIVLPWYVVAWRPTMGVPVSMQALVAGIRLLATGVAMAVGAAIMLSTAARATRA